MWARRLAWIAWLATSALCRKIPHEPLYAQIRDVARDICDHCAKNGQNFTLETGQEPAHVLLRFIADVARPNLKINFDPANMILYGTGDPD